MFKLFARMALKKHAVAAHRRGIVFAARMDACGDGATLKNLLEPPLFSLDDNWSSGSILMNNPLKSHTFETWYIQVLLCDFRVY